MKFTICARLEKEVQDGTVVTRITWETEAENMHAAIEKARAYTTIAERDESAVCVYVTVEAEDA